MISGAMSQSRFLPHCLAPVPAALLNLEQFLTLKSRTGKGTCTATGFSANNAKQVGVTSMWNQIKAQWNSPSWRSLPSQGEVSPRRASARTTVSKNHIMDCENGHYHITCKGNRYFNMVPQPGLLLTAGNIFLSQKQRAMASLCLAAAASTSPGEKFWIWGPILESAFWQDFQVIQVNV